MKHIVLGTGDELAVYAVSDAVAEELEGYCLKFLDWMENNVRAQKFLLFGGLNYTAEDFMDYLNTRVFPKETAVFVEKLGRIPVGEGLPVPYTGCPIYRFLKGENQA
ncbi:MAG: hypothetical protein IKT58_05075 [Oscillospiraceae bacterium]|nr:hypothetical protein [Oscillospiraceae bacterium]